MVIATDKSLAENALTFWESYQHPSIESGVDDIANTLLNHIKVNKWYGSIAGFFESISKYFLKQKARTALSAYKFDLMTRTDPINPHDQNLLSAKESWFLKNDRVNGIFRQILQKKGGLTLEGKAKRFDHKVEKYYDDSLYMTASFGLHVIGKRYPKYANTINKMKDLGKKQLLTYYQALQTDPVLYAGIQAFLEDPQLDAEKPNMSQAAWHIAKAKVCDYAWKFWEQVKAGYEIAREMGSPSILK